MAILSYWRIDTVILAFLKEITNGGRLGEAELKKILDFCILGLFYTKLDRSQEME